VVSNLYRLAYEDCGSEESLNKWELYDITWFDIETKRRYLVERRFLM